jgi:hypothetical protein
MTCGGVSFYGKTGGGGGEPQTEAEQSSAKIVLDFGDIKVISH